MVKSKLAPKARKHVRQVGTCGTKAHEARNLAHSSFIYSFLNFFGNRNQNCLEPLQKIK